MAVFTHITEEFLKQHLMLFDIGRLVSLTGIAEGVENTNYKLVTTQGPFILTLFEKRTQPEDLPFFIAFIEHLRSKGIPSPGILTAKTGEKVISLQGKPAIISTFLEGLWPRQIEVFHAAAAGTLLARMHLAATTFKRQRDNAMSLPAWKALIDLCAGKTDLLPSLQTELDYLQKSWPQGLPAGTIHADVFPDNVFFSGEKITGVIDFYFSCTDAFAYDLMLMFNAWCFETSGLLDKQKSAALLRAYEKERPLTAPERASLPFFGRAAAMRIIATRLYDGLHPAAGAMITPKDPLEYVRILTFYQTGGSLT